MLAGHIDFKMIIQWKASVCGQGDISTTNKTEVYSFIYSNFNISVNKIIKTNIINIELIQNLRIRLYPDS